MRKRKKKEFLKNNSIIPNDGELDNLINAENEYDESARLKKLVLLFLIPMIFILGFLFKSKFNPEIQQEKLTEYEAQQQAKTNKKRTAEIQQLITDADAASEKKNFTKAAFLYNQAISYEPKNVAFHEKLLLTLEESCENDNEMHCNAIEKAKAKLERLK